MSFYELAIIGGASAERRRVLNATLEKMTADFDLKTGDIVTRDANSIASRNLRAAFATAYFGSDPHTDEAIASELVRARQPVVPVVEEGRSVEQDLPEVLRPLNGLRLRRDDPEMTALASAMLECVGLLPRQRRVFVSYRRTESRTAAVQLHDLLSGRGFDVFLDTHDIRPGEVFQDVLWHRLCDSDVLLMLDTPTYFEKKWTRQEFGRARAKDIHILRIVWPDHTPNKHTDIAETIYLAHSDLGPDGSIDDPSTAEIALKVESLRSRSIAARFTSMTGRLRAEVEKIGGEIEGVGAHRAISIRLPSGSEIWAYPVVGVPTAELMHDIAEKARNAEHSGTPVLVYDHVGLRQLWMDHLKWLDEQIAAVRSLRVTEAAWQLAAWDA